jgi:hypothetical protein
VAQAIEAAGGLDAVHRSWQADRDHAIYRFRLPGCTPDRAAVA